jgi:hypothetical protein
VAQQLRQVYSWGGALSITTDVTLDAENNPNAYFVLNQEVLLTQLRGLKLT